VNALWHFFLKPGIGRVYNIGGGIQNNCSVLEAIKLCEQISGRHLQWHVQPAPRNGDHQWWVSDMRAFKNDYPHWDYQFDLHRTLTQIYEAAQMASAHIHEH
jgi:CDP-paratose 2-epimerase